MSIEGDRPDYAIGGAFDEAVGELGTPSGTDRPDALDGADLGLGEIGDFTDTTPILASAADRSLGSAEAWADSMIAAIVDGGA